MPSDRPAPQGPKPHPSIVLFDGTCAFCDRTVRLLLRLDRREVLRFAPLQSEAGVELLRRYPIHGSFDSIVLIHKNKASVESDAALHVCRLLGPPCSLAMALRIIPKALRDRAYRLLAGHRYRLFGRVETCTLPREGQAGRVIETAAQARGLMDGGGFA